jgi:hypothetical protein
MIAALQSAPIKLPDASVRHTRAATLTPAPVFARDGCKTILIGYMRDERRAA